MRIVPHDISSRLAKTMQTKANNANPSSDIWISRPYTALTSDIFLERQTVLESAVTDASIAVCHPKAKKDSTMIYIGYVADGKAKVTSAITKTKMEEHVWLHENFEEDATVISLAFNGTMIQSIDKRVEYISETSPWVFWANEAGALYGRRLDDEGEPINLAVENCVDVSAVYAFDTGTGVFNYGLIVFFVMGGSLFYRQLINGEWMDGEQVVAAPSNIIKIAAFRTWDYRVGVQMQTEDGKVYEIYTQYMGIGKRNVEHFNISDIHATGHITSISYYDASCETEHVDVTDITATGGLWWAHTCTPVFAENIADENRDYGYYVQVTFDHPLLDVIGHESQFYMIDDYGITYGCSEAVTSDDGMMITFKFYNFNVAVDSDLTIYYVAGSNPIQGPGAPVTDFEFTFTPTGLVRPDIPLPELSSATVNDSGTTLTLEFTESLIPETVTKVDSFEVTIKEYDMVPGGTLVNKPRVITSMTPSSDNDKVIYLTFDAGNTKSLQNGEEIIINYVYASLCGYGGPVVLFTHTLTPTGLVKKNNQNDMEHIDISDITATGILRAITQHTATAPDEHCVVISNIEATGALTHINEL